MEETSELRAAIENLYAAFAMYPLRDDTDACACCHNPQDERRLHAKPLRKMNSKDLRQYAADALFVWGDVTDFKHFLPRIFELSLAEGGEFVDPQVVFKKLYHGDWRSWPDGEQRIIEHFLVALWRCVLDSPPRELHGEQVEDWLCGIAQAVGQLSPYLKIWIEMNMENARLNLAGFIANSGFANPNRDPSGYWGERAELFQEVVTWIRSDAVKAKMVTIATEFPQYDFVERAYIFLP